MAAHSSMLAWRIPWTEEPGGLQSRGSQRIRHALVTEGEEDATTKDSQHQHKYPSVRVAERGL